MLQNSPKAQRTGYTSYPWKWGVGGEIKQGGFLDMS